MGANVQRKTWITATSLNIVVGVGATVEVSLTDVPIRGWIRRARITAATGPNVTLNVQQTAGALGAGDFNISLAYSATASPMDQEEDPGVFYQIAQVGDQIARGTLFCRVTSSAGIGDTLQLQLEIEPAI